MNVSDAVAFRGQERAGRAFEISTRLPLVAAVGLVVGCLLLAWQVTYVGGGSRTVLPHLFYVPVILAASRFRWAGAAATAVAAGMLVGPLMPSDVATGASQSVANWSGRLVAFVVVGLLAAWLTTESRQSILGRVQDARTAAELRTALREDQFVVYYQPILHLGTRQVVGFEALCRWQHPTRGLVSPADFIPAAERTGVIVPIGQYVLREATRQLATWTSGGDNLSVAINVSATQLGHADLIHDVRTALKDTDLDSSLLHIELTETAVISDLETASTQIGTLRDLGVQVAIDDFGVGQSSLSLLHHLPIDIIKIDRSFVAEMATEPKCASMVQGIIRLANAVGARTIGEGIETHEQCGALQALDCHYGQGFHLAPPAPARDIDPLLTARPAHDRRRTRPNPARVMAMAATNQHLHNPRD